GCVFTRLPILSNVSLPTSDDLVSLIKTYAELSIAVDELRNQFVEDLEIELRENNLVGAVLYCSADSISSCGLVKERIENLLSRMCEMLNCRVKTVKLDFPNILPRSLKLR
ncbi:MAG: hypothetical protein ACK416_03845, partial [Zestosphaera sp.]